MDERFSLPAVDAALMAEVGVVLPAHLASGMVSPRLCVLGMGFSWSLYFCQFMMEACVLAPGVPVAHMNSDRQLTPTVAEAGVLCAAYVDGVAGISEDPYRAKATIEAVAKS